MKKVTFKGLDPEDLHTSNTVSMEVKVRVKKADLEKCETQLDVIELVSGEWLKQHHPFKRK